ncbi:hypothetical protein ACWGIU_06550, partial [Streptomyces sp. NPDC054840]
MDAVNGRNDTGCVTGAGPGENPAAGAPAISLHAPAPTAPADTPGPVRGGAGPAPAGANRTLGRGIATGLWG